MMKINCWANFAWICLFYNVVWAESVDRRARRGRRALYSHPSGPEEIKRVVRIETFYSADRVTDVDFCTGVLLNETIVLTAAHCIYRTEKEHPIGYLVFGNGQMVSGGLYARHPNYKYGKIDEMPNDSNFICHDIAMLFLNSPIKIPFNEESPKLVVDCGSVYKTGECASHGAGITESGKLSQKILKVPLPNIHPSKNVPFNNKACFETKYMNKERLCQGDSGGPVICSTKGKMSVIGVSVQVISYDSPKSDVITETCKISFGSIVTNTAAILDLIKRLPKSLKTQVMESVEFENCKLHR